MIGIVREVAPAKGAETDKEFGLSVYQDEYFEKNPVYLDEEMTFFNALGRKGIFLSKTNVYNPFSLLWLLGKLWRKMSNRGISGNTSAGDGRIMGGIVVIRDGKIVYHAGEDLEDPFDYAEIAAAATGKPVEEGKRTGTFLDPNSPANVDPQASVLSQKQKDTLEVCYSPKDCA